MGSAFILIAWTYHVSNCTDVGSGTCIGTGLRWHVSWVCSLFVRYWRRSCDKLQKEEQRINKACSYSSQVNLTHRENDCSWKSLHLKIRSLHPLLAESLSEAVLWRFLHLAALLAFGNEVGSRMIFILPRLIWLTPHPPSGIAEVVCVSCVLDVASPCLSNPTMQQERSSWMPSPEMYCKRRKRRGLWVDHPLTIGSADAKAKKWIA